MIVIGSGNGDVIISLNVESKFLEYCKTNDSNVVSSFDITIPRYTTFEAEFVPIWVERAFVCTLWHLLHSFVERNSSTSSTSVRCFSAFNINRCGVRIYPFTGELAASLEAPIKISDIFLGSFKISLARVCAAFSTQINFLSLKRATFL